MIFDFLANFVNQEKIKKISEAKGFESILSFLERFFQTHFQSGGEDTLWLQTAQYFLTSCAQPADISLAIQDLLAIRQRKNG